MPTRFWVKRTGYPSSISIAIDTNRNIGEKRNNKISAESLLSIIIK